MKEESILPATTLRKIINSAYYKINEAYLANEDDLSEYEIQYLFYDSLKKQIKNKGCIAKKEREKVDITITDVDNTLKYRIEVKSYIKSHEKISINALNKDLADLEEFLGGKESLEKKAFLLIAIREKTLQSSSIKNKLLASYLNHKSKVSPLHVTQNFKHTLTSSYTIAKNNSIDKVYIGQQVRLFLIEIKKK